MREQRKWKWRKSWRALALAVLLIGCSSNERSPTAVSSAASVGPERGVQATKEVTAPRDAAPRDSGPGWPGANPPGVAPRTDDAGPACEVELFSSVVETPDGHWDVIARARNRTPRSLTLTLPKVCTGGPVELAGIPGYDYYGRCAQGACARPPEGRSAVRVEPRSIVELARGRVDPGGNACNAPVPPGRYPALMAADLQGAVVCLGPADVMDLNPGSPVAPTPHPVPAPKPRPVKPIPPPKPCPPAPACGIACPGGHQAHDANGCPLCACEEFGPSIVPPPSRTPPSNPPSL